MLFKRKIIYQISTQKNCVGQTFNVMKRFQVLHQEISKLSVGEGRHHSINNASAMERVINFSVVLPLKVSKFSPL